MNYWTNRSREYALGKNYLDELFRVYPISINPPRPLSLEQTNRLYDAIEARNDIDLINTCLDAEVFPIKDSYIGFIKQDRTAMQRNPETVSRIASIIYDMGIDEVLKVMERPAETNRQMGPAFKNWISKETLGIEVVSDINIFSGSEDNMILNLSDRELGEYARIYLGYGRNSGLDFLCRYNNKYVIGEAKFITAVGGNQKNQFNSAMNIFTSITTTTKYRVIPVAILDGVIYLEGNNFFKASLDMNNNDVFSALLLRDFIYQL